MKVIGVIGGVGWPSTAEYYRLLNQESNYRCGSNHSAELVLYSFDYAPIARLQQQERWEDLARLLIQAAEKLQAAGAELLLIACNTLHIVATQVQDAIGIPLLHIAEAAAQEAKNANLSVIGLLGSCFVMEQEFYKGPFLARGIKVILPGPTERSEVNRVIFEELSRGEFLETSRARVLKVIDGLWAAGASAIVLGCTELPLLIRAEDTSVKLLDTMAIHVRTAVSLADQPKES